MSRDQGNSPDWYLYEQAVARLLAEMDPGADVEHHVRVIGELSGRPREIDIRVIGAVAGCTVVVAVECKHRRKPVGIGIIEEFLTKASDIGADLGLLVSSSGFTEPARRRVRRACGPRLLLQHVSFGAHITLTTLADLQRRYVLLHRKLNESGLDIQTAWNLSRQHDETARRLREHGSSGAEALTA